VTTAHYFHDDCLDHVTPPGHPEQVARYEAVMRALSGDGFGALDRREAPLASRVDLMLCHPEAYIERVAAAVPEEGWASLDADTHLSPGSMSAALRAAGGCVAAVDAVLAGEVANAFVGCRPPGHHAERETAMGFCLFGSAAMAARHAADRHGLDRVAIVDFDVHHGNGTQDLIWDEARVLFVSSHQMPLYPGSGYPHETGAHDNVPLAPHTGGAEMRKVYENEAIPALLDFRPELIVVSAGFDAHAADPLANLNWTVEDFAWITGRICDVAEECCDGRVVSTLEGGYDLSALGASVAAHLRVLMERGG
jgi:acetoin utilization deacetylase AcuC-like enzyme